MSNTKNTSQSQSSREPHDSQESQEERRSAPDERRPAPIEVVRRARSQLAEFTGLAPESVTSFEPTEDGWTLEMEVMEIARVPDTMSLMASYQVELDHHGRLTGYRRVQRYERGRSDARRPGGR